MAENIQGLIEKIQEEGIKQAEAVARQIEGQAREKALSIVREAEQKAREAEKKARSEIEKYRQNSEEALTQAARDLIISLRKEINTLLGRILRVDIAESLTQDTLEHILLSLIKGCAKQAEGEIIISLSEQETEKLKKHFLAKLRAETAAQITLRSRDEIGAGFTISFDSGKSQYDFSDTALAEYVGMSVKPQLAEILARASE